jgi:putative endopeptidase
MVIKRDDLVGNVKAVTSWNLDREMKKIGSAIDREEWFMKHWKGSLLENF